ncbi:MAG: hypothetical protein KJ072_29090, partial [Verrucomicrobia bacterium]|nr:hypothetical protein [Verrucomicrobiota bacterium]
GGGGCSATLAPNGTWSDGDCLTTVLNSYFYNLPTMQFYQDAITQRSRYKELGYDLEDLIELQSEYNDELLYTMLLAKLPGFSGDWLPGPNNAFYSLSSDHVCAQGGRMQYRFRVPSTSRDVTYRIDWERVAVFPDGSINVTPQSEEFEGTGGEWLSGEHLEEVPESPSTVTLRNVTISIVESGDDDGDDTGTPGSGSVGGGGGPCRSCSSGIPPGEAAHPWGVALQISMGQTQLGRSAGFLVLARSTPHPSLATPDALQFTSTRPEIEVIQVDGRIRQIRALQALADIVVVTPYKYEIRFYLLSQVGAKQGGLYQVSGSPFVTWRIENPDASPTTYHRLQITEIRGAESRVHLYVYSSATHSWTLTQPGDLREFQLFALAESATARSQELIVRKPGGATAYRLYRKFEQFSWGEGLTQIKEGDPASPRLTTYAYYTSPGFTPSGTVLPVETVTYPDNSWERFQYDSQGRVTLRLATFLNQAPTWTESSCRSTTYAYTPLSGSGDTGALEPRTPRTVIDKVLGQEVGRRYTVIKAGERRDIRCQTVGAAWTNAADNLVTITKFFTSGPNIDRISSIQHPDGTMTFHSYTDNADSTRTTVVDSGQPNVGLTAITAGTRTTITNAPLGPLIFRGTKDIASMIVTSSATYSSLDAFDRPQRVTYLDGTFADTYYSCCGIDQTIDRDGATTQFTYDALGRQVTSTRYGITITNILDA